MSEEEKKVIEYLKEQRAYAHKFGNRLIITISTMALKLTKKQQQELQLKDKVIDGIVNNVVSVLNINNIFCKENGCFYYAGENKKTCDECIKQYFINKVKGE